MLESDKTHTENIDVEADAELQTHTENIDLEADAELQTHTENIDLEADAELHPKYFSGNFGDPVYFTSDIDGGYGNTEIVTGQTNPNNDEADGVIVVSNINAVTEPDEQNENELYTATPLDFSTYLPENDIPEISLKYLTDENEIQYNPGKQGYHKPDDSNDSSDASHYTLFKEFSDDEIYFSDASATSEESLHQTKGNIPKFDELSIPTSGFAVGKIFPNPLVSKLMPTATASYKSDTGSPEAPSTNKYESSATFPEIEEAVTLLSPRSTPSSLSATLFSFGSAVTSESSSPPVRLTSEQVSSHLETKRPPRIYRVRDTYCSTGTQSALPGKLSSCGDSTIEPLQFPVISLSSLKSLISTSRSTDDEKKSDQMMKRRPSKIVELDTAKHFDKEIKRDMRNFKDVVGKAFEESVSEGSMMPLLKKELQYKIQVRRLSRGEPELELKPEEPKSYQLTPEEVIKKEMRLEQNRMSANRSRMRAQKRLEELQKDVKTEMKKHARLRGELDALTKARNKMQTALTVHQKMCTLITDPEDSKDK